MPNFLSRFLFLIFLMLSSVSGAMTCKQQVHCPSLSLLHQAANQIVDAAFVNGSYIATTKPYGLHTGNIGWFAVVYQLHAHAKEAALAEARNAMATIAEQDSVYAHNAACIYWCDYAQGKISVISND